MNEFRLLVRKDGWSIKNHFLEIKNNPKRLIIYLLYLVWLSTLVLNAVMNSRHSLPIQGELGPQIIGAGFGGLAVGLVLYFVYQGTRESSTFFTMGDVNLLFPAPVSPKKVLLYSMLKQSLLHFFLYGFMVLALMPMLFNLVKIDMRYFPYLYCGFISLILVIAPLNFLLFSLGSKYGIQTKLQQGITVLAAGFGLYLAGTAIAAGDVWLGLLRGLNAPFFTYLPVVGWSKAMFMTAITGYQPFSSLALLLQAVFLAVCISLAYYAADDYYEDVQKATEKRNLRKKRKEGSEKTRHSSFQLIRGKRVNVGKAGTGPWAMFWRSRVEYSRTDLHPYGGIWTLLFFLVGTVAGLAGAKYAAGLLPLYLANGITAYMLFVFAAANAGQHELTKPYIYLIPGTNWLKIVSSNLTEIIRMGANILALNIPLGILLRVSPGITALMAGFVLSFYVLNLLANYLIRILFPNALDQKALFPLFLMLQILLLVLPGLIVGGIAAAIFRNPLLIFVGIAAVNLVMIGLLLLLSDALFARLEWR